MKKIKEIWRNNKVIFVLFIILIICVVAIITVALSYFVGTNNNPYGNRLDNKVELPKDFAKSIEKSLDADEFIKKSDVRLAVRTIYINIEFVGNINLEDAQNKAISSFELISQEILDYYDINFVLNKEASDTDAGFTIMGARNSFGTGVVWNNNRPVEEKKD